MSELELYIELQEAITDHYQENKEKIRYGKRRIFMFNYSKKIRKESENISWLSISQISKEALGVVLVSILFAFFIGGINALLQQTFNQLLAM